VWATGHFCFLLTEKRAHLKQGASERQSFLGSKSKFRKQNRSSHVLNRNLWWLSLTALKKKWQEFLGQWFCRNTALSV
jgi:hypothetical protein